MLDAVVRTIAATLRLTGHTTLPCVDADTARSDLFHRFGPTTDTDEPKPAFATYRALVAGYGG